jgi:hypothetical protein
MISLSALQVSVGRNGCNLWLVDLLLRVVYALFLIYYGVVVAEVFFARMP